MRVGQVMSRLSVCLYLHNTLDDALALMKEKKVPGLPLVNELGYLLGMVVKDHILDKGLDNILGDKQAVEYITTRFVPLKEDTLVEDVWDLPFEIYPVYNDREEITGVISKYSLGQAFFQQSQLRLQELEAVFNSAHNGILAVNKQGIITSLNPAAERPTRSTMKEAAGRFLTDVIVPTGLLEVVRTGIPEFGVKFQVGKRQYITNRSPIIKDGEVIGAVGVFQDVSEIEKTLKELSTVKHLNDELNTIINSSYDGIIISDSQGEILRSNSAVERILGIPSAELVGTSFRGLLDRGLFTKNIILLVRKEQEPVSILERPYADHSLVITGNPVFDEDGEITKIVINIRDMSEILVLREALEESKQLSEKYESEIAQMRSNVEPQVDLIFRSNPMKVVMDIATRVSQVDSPVVLIGERGAGKEEIAKFIHNNSERKAGPFYKLNCASLPETILEAELFGYTGGAFAGARKNGKTGILELANSGTLLLEEIGEMSQSLQAKFLRFLQDKEVKPMGSEKRIKVDIRVIASVKQALKGLVENGTFREDLFFRLNVVPIKVPSLRERKEDIIPLLHYFLRQNNERYNLNKEFSPEAINMLLSHQWPGNIREMANIIERLVVTTKEKVISAQEVAINILEEDRVSDKTISISGVIPLKSAIDEVEHQLVTLAMEKYGTTVKAAEALGVNQSTVVRKLKKQRS